ncbi:MAG TPA: TerC family protein [Candidatus Thermoplasmatota archaeon]|nr:TerC family protein [Candidatus Thermoplasmatota archaeon]
MLELLTDPNVWLAFATLTALEIVLGIDNVIFITILADKLPQQDRARARRLGLAGAMFMRIGLLLSLAWIIGLTAPLFTVVGFEISGRDIVLLLGGLFLMAKSTHEIHGNLEGAEGHAGTRVPATLFGVVAQIMVLDVVFSLDSVITAVGIVDDVPVMVAAIVTAVAIMMFFAGPVGAYVTRHPTIKMLALSFLLMIGVALVAESFDVHIPKGYLYFSMVFSLGVEVLNLRTRKAAAEPVTLHKPYTVENARDLARRYAEARRFVETHPIPFGPIDEDADETNRER